MHINGRQFGKFIEETIDENTTTNQQALSTLIQTNPKIYHKTLQQLRQDLKSLGNKDLAQLTQIDNMISLIQQYCNDDNHTSIYPVSKWEKEIINSWPNIIAQKAQTIISQLTTDNLQIPIQHCNENHLTLPTIYSCITLLTKQTGTIQDNIERIKQLQSIKLCLLEQELKTNTSNLQFSYIKQLALINQLTKDNKTDTEEFVKAHEALIDAQIKLYANMDTAQLQQERNSVQNQQPSPYFLINQLILEKGKTPTATAHELLEDPQVRQQALQYKKNYFSRMQDCTLAADKVKNLTFDAQIQQAAIDKTINNINKTLNNHRSTTAQTRVQAVLVQLLTNMDVTETPWTTISTIVKLTPILKKETEIMNQQQNTSNPVTVQYPKANYQSTNYATIVHQYVTAKNYQSLLTTTRNNQPAQSSTLYIDQQTQNYAKQLDQPTQELIDLYTEILKKQKEYLNQHNQSKINDLKLSQQIELYKIQISHIKTSYLNTQNEYIKNLKMALEYRQGQLTQKAKIQKLPQQTL